MCSLFTIREEIFTKGEALLTYEVINERVLTQTQKGFYLCVSRNSIMKKNNVIGFLTHTFKSPRVLGKKLASLHGRVLQYKFDISSSLHFLFLLR